MRVDKLMMAYWPDIRLCVLLFLIPAAIADGLTGYTMYGHCGNKFSIPRTGMRLTLTAHGESYQPNLDCSLKLRVPAGMRIIVQFESVSIYGAPYGNHLHCIDWLEVRNGFSRQDDTVSGMADHVCGTGVMSGYERSIFTTTDRYVTLVFKSGAVGFKEGLYTGFSLILTTYRRLNGTKDSCTAVEYKCKYSNRCISYGIMCDRDVWNPCGDGSPRPSYCYGFHSTTAGVSPPGFDMHTAGAASKGSMNVTAVAIMTVGGVILLMIITIAIVVYRQMRKRTCRASGRQLSRSTRRAFRTRRGHSNVISENGPLDCGLSTITHIGLPPPYSEIAGDCEQLATNHDIEDPPPPYTEINFD